MLSDFGQRSQTQRRNCRQRHVPLRPTAAPAAWMEEASSVGPTPYSRRYQASSWRAKRGVNSRRRQAAYGHPKRGARLVAPVQAISGAV